MCQHNNHVRLPPDVKATRGGYQLRSDAIIPVSRSRACPQDDHGARRGAVSRRQGSRADDSVPHKVGRQRLGMGGVADERREKLKG